MQQPLRRGVVVATLLTAAAVCQAQRENHCGYTHPPSVYAVATPYPFQAGSERTFDELYHGLWKARVDIPIFQAPGTGHRSGVIHAGTVIDAVDCETLVIHPLRFTAARDLKVGAGFSGGLPRYATIPKGEAFWVLETEGEGSFSIWWRCGTYGWDSTEPAAILHEKRSLGRLGTNEQHWVHIRDPKTGTSGWFRDIPAADGKTKLEPAQPTTKATG